MGPFWTFFAQIWVKMNFPGKTNALSVFKYSNYLLSCQKSEKANEPFFKKKRTDAQIDRQTDNSDFIGPSKGWGPKK